MCLGAYVSSSLVYSLTMLKYKTKNTIFESQLSENILSYPYTGLNSRLESVSPVIS